MYCFRMWKPWSLRTTEFTQAHRALVFQGFEFVAVPTPAVGQAMHTDELLSLLLEYVRCDPVAQAAAGREQRFPGPPVVVGSDVFVGAVNCFVGKLYEQSSAGKINAWDWWGCGWGCGESCCVVRAGVGAGGEVCDKL